MAQEDNPFASLMATADTPKGVTTEKAQEPKAIESKPLSSLDRIIISALFDTQPKRRAAYLKKLGWELDPKDDNKIRPLGSDVPFVTEIDPGGFFNVSQYMASKYGDKKEPKKEAVSELAKDSAEGMLDLIQGALIEGAGQVVGLASGAAAGAPTAGAAAVPAYMTGRASGRAYAYNLLEYGKDIIGDMLLDENVPPDMSARLMQTAFQAVGPEAMQPITAGVGKAIKGTFTAVKTGVSKLVTMGGGKIDDVSLKAIATNPKEFADPAKLERGGQIVQDQINSLFGIGPEDQVPKKFSDLGENSLFKTKMSDLDRERRIIAGMISQDPKASITVADAANFLQSQIDSIPPASLRSESGGDIAVDYFNRRIKKLVQDHGQKGKLTFQELDQLVKSLQEDAYNRNDNASGFLRSTAGKLNGMIKGMAEKAADRNPAIGKYADIKAQEAKIFDSFDSASQNINKKNMLNMIVGGAEDQAPTAFGKDVSRNAATESIKRIDDALGTNYYEGIRTGQIQNNIFQAMKSGQVPQGSSGAIARGALGYAAGNAIAPGMGIPAAAGAIVLGMPQVGLPIAGIAARGEQAVQSGILDAINASQTATSQGVSKAINPAIEALLKQAPQNIPQSTPAVPVTPEDDDPFAALKYKGE
jgi:hypothetical protein